MRFLALLVFVTGCGTASEHAGDVAAQQQAASDTSTSTSTDTTQNTSDEHHSMLVADAGALPACDASAEGWLIYLKAEAKFQTCSEGKWADVDIKGEKGEAGQAGADGASNHIVESWVCDRTLDNSVIKAVVSGSEAIDIDVSPPHFDKIRIFYNASKTRSGDLFVGMTLYDFSAAATMTLPNTAFYSSGATAAADGQMTQNWDVMYAANGGSFSVAINDQNGINIEYTDQAPDPGYANFGAASRTVGWAEACLHFTYP